MADQFLCACGSKATYLQSDGKTVCGKCKPNKGGALSAVHFPKITSKQEGGDDGYCYVVRVDGVQFVNDLTRNELDYYKRQALSIWIERRRNAAKLKGGGIISTGDVAVIVFPEPAEEDPTRGVKPGDSIRLYGMPGLFVVDELVKGTISASRYDFFAFPAGGRREDGFPSHYENVVELNHLPLPCLSAPLTPPASDYPHEPTFDYDDAPQELGEDAIAIWQDRRARERPQSALTLEEADELTRRRLVAQGEKFAKKNPNETVRS